MAPSCFMSGVLFGLSHLLLSIYVDAVSAQVDFRQPASPSYSGRDACPQRCIISGPNPSNWSAYHNFQEFQSCRETLFHGFNIHDEVDDASTFHRIYSCTSYGSDWANLPNSLAETPIESVHNATYEVGWSSGDFTGKFAGGDLIVLTGQLRQYLANGHGPVDESTLLFAQVGQLAIGIYIGKGLQNEGLSLFALQAFEDTVLSSKPNASSIGMQMCQPGHDGDHIFGIMATSNGTFTPIQNTIKTWAEADCVSFDESKTFTGPAYFSIPPLIANGTSSKSHHSNWTENFKLRISPLSARGDCRTVQVKSGDSCAALAQRCGISGPNFMKYNPGSKFCSTLVPGQHVCCSSGSLPDFRPKPNSDGSCRVYIVRTGDSCSRIAAANSISIKDIEKYNKETWGWNGCTNIWDKIRICLSSGTPPMPAPVANAICGPQVPGTRAPTDGTDISELNPCPLNACCNVWGQCGLTEEFCVDTNTGAPGTARPGTNGCISNCGTTIVPGDAPAVFRKIGYFEGYSFSSRECLYQDALQIDGSQYTHIHFGFGMITHDYQIDTGNAETTYQFENFKLIQGAKRILSFGGWAFSTSPDTYTIFREGVKAANRVRLAVNIANFVKDHGLDGVDIDWEYPAAPDMQDIPPAPKEEGMDYFKFLVILKSLLPGKSVSIAAPASYWYLKGFPIRMIGQIVDYIVFMTYDLHGQWDSQNQWSQAGCPSGMCLRSGVNLTETMNALVMVTKAGVPSNKVVVGVTSYGRSFGMAQAGCHGPDCLYLGGPLNSYAKKGRCTAMAGYIADAEIKEILRDSSRVNQNYLDGPSDSNILVYDDTQWVSYMSPEVRATRTEMYKSLNMGGTSDWAIDLQDFHDVPVKSVSSDWGVFKEYIKVGLNPYHKREREGNWTSLTCTDPAVVDNNYLTPSERWSRLDCPDAWKDVVDIWKTSYKGKLGKSFSQAVSNILHGPEYVHCESLRKSNYCDQPKQCTDFAGSGTGPAAYEIFNSLVNIHGMYDDFEKALTDEAATYIANALPDFENKFAPVPPGQDDEKWLQVLLDLITLGASVVAGPVFNSCKSSLIPPLHGPAFLSKLPYFLKNPATANTLKDTTMTLIGQSTSIAKDMLNSKSSNAWTAGKQSEFSHYMGQALSAWSNLVEKAVEALFDGEDQSIDILTSLISDGKLIQGKGESGSLSNAAIKALVGKAFFAYAIPAIWSASGASPFIIDSGFDCGAIDPIGRYMVADALHKSWACVDDKLYYLASPKGSASYCYEKDTKRPEDCTDQGFSALPGVEFLDGTSFGKVTRTDLITGAVRTYKANGNQNIDTSSDRGKLASANSLGQDITAPGYIRMPVCSPAMAWKAWFGRDVGEGPDTSAPGYPCVVIDSIGFCGPSTFVDQTSGVSPLVSDCRKLIEKIQFRSEATTHEVENAVGTQHQIEEYGKCRFGVEGNGKNGNIDFHVGGQDIIDIINDAIKMFGSSGRVGAKGNMNCKGTIKDQNVDWGLY